MSEASRRKVRILDHGAFFCHIAMNELKPVAKSGFACGKLRGNLCTAKHADDSTGAALQKSTSDAEPNSRGCTCDYGNFPGQRDFHVEHHTFLTSIFN
jgi:hypothetical protein